MSNPRRTGELELRQESRGGVRGSAEGTALRRTQKTTRATPTPAPTGRRHSLSLKITLFNLLFTAVAGAHLLVSPPLLAIDATGRYQPFKLTGPVSGLPLESARRVNDLLVLTATDAWLQLEQPAREDLVGHLKKHLLGHASLRQLLVVDRMGRRLAFTDGSRLEVTRGKP